MRSRQRDNVAAFAADDLHVPVEGRGNIERVLETDRRIDVSPTVGARVVPVAIPPKVEARARAKLKNAESIACPMGDLEEASEQSSAASDFVGLAAPRQQVGDLGFVFDQRPAKRGPGRPRGPIASRRRIVRRQVRELSRQHQPMHSAHEAYSECSVLVLVFETSENTPDRPIFAEVIRQRSQKRCVKRGA